MELRDYLRVARRWGWLVVLGALFSGLIGFVITTQLTPVYRAHAIVLVNQTQTSSVITYQDVLGSQQLANTYARLAVTDTNLSRALADVPSSSVTLEELRDQARATVAKNTQLIDIAVESADPADAARLANAIAANLPGYIREAQLAGAAPDAPLNSVFVAQQASIPENPVSPNNTLNVVLACIAGALVLLVAIAVIEHLTDTIDGASEIEALDATALGSVWRVPGPAGSSNADWRPKVETDAGLRESLGRVQANLAFALTASKARIVLVTSPHAGDGKTTIAVNLASMLGHAGRRVLLIDGDLRKPAIHAAIGLHNSSGLSSVFLMSPAEASTVVTTVSDSLDVMTAGPVPPNPMDWLASGVIDDVLRSVSPGYDLVLVDSPPILGIADASLWASHVDGVIMVVRRGKTTRRQLADALKAVRASQKPVLGIVLNAARRTRSEGYYDEYAYRYGGPSEGVPGPATGKVPGSRLASAQDRPGPRDRGAAASDRGTPGAVQASNTHD